MMAYEPIRATSTPRPRLHWFRYSLRTLLLVVTGLALWLGWKINAAREQQRAVATIREYGGRVKYDFEFGAFDATPQEPGWLTELLGKDFLHNVVDMHLDSHLGNIVDFKTLASQLRQLPWLRRIELADDTVRDDDLQLLSRFDELEYLFLERNHITGVGLKYLTNLRKLHSVILDNSSITNQWLEAIATLPNLTQLILDGTDITDGGVPQLVTDSSLKTLSLRDTNLTDACLESLAKLPNLSGLDVRGTHVTADGVRRLQHLRPTLFIDWSHN